MIHSGKIRKFSSGNIMYQSEDENRRIRTVKNSFRTRIIVLFLVVIIGCMAAMILLSNLLLRPLFINDSKRTMERYGADVCAAIEENADPDEIKELLDQINNAYVIRTAILSEKRVLLYNENGDGSEQLSASMERTIFWLHDYETEHGYRKPFFHERYDENYKLRRLFYVCKTETGHYVIMNKAIKGIEQDSRIVFLFITIMGIAVAVIGAVTWSFLTKPLTSQIEKMSRITQKMSRLNFDEKIGYKSQDELGVLADSIDELSDHLKKSIETLQRDLESRKHLVRNLSHELKTPITTIRGYAENVQILMPEHAKMQKYCGVMLEECDEMENLIAEMLEMSRLESEDAYEKMPIFAEELFQKISQKSRIQYPDAAVQFFTESCIVYGNMQLLERAVHNYIQNAVKYGEKGERITVKGKCSGQKYIISVTNRGKTIPREEQDSLWDVFYKSDKARKRNKSHGIGLSIVRQIAVIHGGGTEVQSQDGVTQFLIWIPFVEKNI